MNGEYISIEIEELPGGSFQGYSRALNLNLRWVDGELVFYEPATGRPIANRPMNARPDLTPKPAFGSWRKRCTG